MTVLFDTNVIVELEGPYKALSSTIADMVRTAHEVNCDIVVHPAQIDDLNRDADFNRRTIQLSRIKQYPMLDNPPAPTEFDLMSLGWSQNNDHDRIDNLLLFAVKRSAVRFLVTEDRRMHSKARKAKINERVFFVGEFLEYLKAQKHTGIRPSACVAISTKFLYELDVDRPFFDSLRSRYKGFNDWYNSSAEKRRQAWVIKDGDEIGALCIFKEEHDETVTDDGVVLRGKVLKLCTFKVADIGKKLGERLLFVAFQAARDGRFDCVYLHVADEGQDHLLELLDDYGFEFIGKYKGDSVYSKDMRKSPGCFDAEPEKRLVYDIKHYPYVADDPNVRKFVVPIQPNFHDRLFPDLKAQMSLFDITDGLTSESNAIKKAYLCKSKSTLIRPGDLVLFYRSKDVKSIRCVGVVEDTLRSGVADELAAFVSKRTVFSRSEIEDMTKTGPALAVLFRVVRYFKKPIDSAVIQRYGIAWPIQSIITLPEAAYVGLFKDLINE